MYNKFFNFKEKPFKLVPDPHYLFLSKSHEEALAHLTYVVMQGDGFVEITGEVGTGKTTLCRAFLENLDSNTEVAYIFNPKLNSVQLLKAVNDEFAIPSDADNIKDLIDALNTFLLEKKAQAKNVIILIDEAHNLGRQVLEQIRLLSNLETTRHKLLQIILVGQPELAEMIDSPEFRSLRQRIVLSCHLFPLTRTETRAYIQHRMDIASSKPQIRFTRPAMNRIFRFSGGTPRLINIVCDRALLIAFGRNRKDLSGAILRNAVKELSDVKQKRHTRSWALRTTPVLGLLFSLLLILGLFIYLPRDNTHPPVPDPPPELETQRQETTANIIEPVGIEPEGIQDVSSPETASKAALPGPEVSRKPAHEVNTVEGFKRFLEDLDQFSSRKNALKTAVGFWSPQVDVPPSAEAIKDDLSFFHTAAARHKLLIRPVTCDLYQLKKMDLPAMLQLSSPKRFPVYLTLGRMNGDTITLLTGDSAVKTKASILGSFWSGIAFIPWKNFMNIQGAIPLNASKQAIVTLKQLLIDMGVEGIDTTPIYDDKTRTAVRNIQKKFGVETDGIVGSTTKIILYNESKRFSIPRMSEITNFS